MFLTLGKIIASAGLAFAALFGYHQTQPVFGNYNPTGGGTYRLQSSVGTTDTSITLSSFKEPISNIAYTMSYLNSSIEFGTLEPGNSSKREFISFSGITQNSDGTATLTGVVRGLSSTPGTVQNGQPIGCVASTTLQLTHAGQSIFIISNSPCFYNQYAPLNTLATSTATLVFSSTTPPHYDSPSTQASGSYISTTSELVSWAGLTAVTNAGTVNATQAVKGIVQIATAIQQASSTPLGAGSTGATLAIPTSLASSSPVQSCDGTATIGALCVPVAQNDGKISPNFQATSSAYTYRYAASTTFSGTLTSTATTTITANSSTNNALILNGQPYSFPSSQGASSTAMLNDGSGNLTNEPVWHLIQSTTTSQAMAAATTTFETTKDLLIRFLMPSAGNKFFCYEFNSDRTASYLYSDFENYSSVNNNGASAATLIAVSSGSVATTTNISGELRIRNEATQRKQMFWEGQYNPSTSQYPLQFSGNGVWTNTASTITTFVLDVGGTNCVGSGTVPSGTIIRVYGSN